MNLLIDSGNTTTKVALFNEGLLVERIRLEQPEDILSVLERYAPSQAIVSSVNKSVQEFQKYMNGIPLLVVDSSTKVPLENLYGTPSTLGMDRLVGMVGAMTLFPNQSCLCIDAGTCITYDCIGADRKYYGGSISPGIDMRFKALHTFTAKLPLITRKMEVSLIGTTTEESILSGVEIGTIKEMEGIIQEYMTLHPSLQIIITGGDAGFFESRIKDTIFVAPDLIFLGLNRILEYNAVNL